MSMASSVLVCAALFDAISAHFRDQGTTRIRTLADPSDAVLGFLNRLGFRPAPLVALEMTVPGGRSVPKYS